MFASVSHTDLIDIMLISILFFALNFLVFLKLLEFQAIVIILHYYWPHRFKFSTVYTKNFGKKIVIVYYPWSRLLLRCRVWILTVILNSTYKTSKVFFYEMRNALFFSTELYTFRPRSRTDVLSVTVNMDCKSIVTFYLNSGVKCKYLIRTFFR